MPATRALTAALGVMKLAGALLPSGAGPTWIQPGGRIGAGGNARRYVGKSWADDVRWLRDWIDKRVRWLDTNLPGVCP